MADSCAGAGPTLSRSDLLLLGGAGAAIALAGVTATAGAPGVLAFVCSGAAVALLAALVGRCVEQLGDRFGAGATGVLQSALGNLPELFIGFFALRAGLVEVVRAAIIGSILGNALLVLGLAFVVGGLRHGEQRFDASRARAISAQLILMVAAMVLPGIATFVHAPAGQHERTFSVIVALVLLGVFALSLPASLARGEGLRDVATEPPRWPLGLAVALLALSGLAAAFVSDWFVNALAPAMSTLHISQEFAGLVVVALAGNAIENVAGIQLAARNRADYALSVIVNSPLQIALVLAPVLVLISGVAGAVALTLVFSPMLMAAVALTVVAVTFIIFDGRSNWLEGASLIALYAVIATAFWWG
ncbi:MAG TPA: sodium:proton exchanger [Candidatus Eisenbacteria bacterium]|nr:sodium:proton exchanger [Candidatus Eisenbacteria bacterium]